MKPRLVFLLVVGVALSCVVGAGRAAADSGLRAPKRDNDRGHWFEQVCATPGARIAGCGAQVVSNSSGDPLAAASPPSGAYGPVQYHTAYNLPYTTSAATNTIAIVDAYNDPTAEADLGVYDTQYGLPACTTANGCFEKVNQTGGTSYPPTNGGWALEIALDVETAHEICTNCKILLVEATSNSFADLGAAENESAALGANEISNSWSGGEYSGETSDELNYFKHPGIAITFATGDDGYGGGVGFPASSQYVTAVGGTTLHVNASTNAYVSESAWSGAGSGCSAYEPKPAWQTDTGCSRRSIADVSADADPNTGAAVYDSTPDNNSSGWFQVGGTSLATPLIAAVYGLAGNSSVNYGETPYLNPGALHDVSSGSNGSCSPSYLCTATTGFDGPTGLGTPNGLAAFTAGPPAPTFSLSAAPTSRTIAQAGSATYTVVAAPSNGFADTVALSTSGLPAGASGAFVPASLNTSNPSLLSSTLTVTTTASIAPGTYTFTISATNGTLTRTATATLIVTPPPPALTASPATVGPAGTVSVSWSNVVGPTRNNWIGLYATGAANNAFLSGSYDDDCGQNPGTTSLSAGSCSFKLPSSGGTYEFRLFATKATTLIATSNTVTVSVVKASPSLSTQASAGIALGATVKDTATLAGGTSPTGTITFKLYGPADGTCTGTPVSTSATTVSGNATYNSASYTPTQLGTYHWIASYSGDASNNSTAGTCGTSGESVTVIAASPTLSTQASAGVALGGTVKDVATLAGGSGATGTITFNLYGPGDTSCTAAAVFTSTVTVGGNGQYTSALFQPSSTGTYNWIASYSGDGVNNAVAGTCGTTGESVTVSNVKPTLGTQASAGVTIGGSVQDVASLAGGSAPTGTITFSLYGPGNPSCSAPAAFTSTVPVSGNGQYTSASFQPSSTGTYLWIASYSGDTVNGAVAATCGASGESVTVSSAGPALTLSTQSTTRGATITVSWSGVTSPTTTDWIGLYVPGAANTAYLSWLYDSSCTTSAAGTARGSGSCSFKLPSTAGTYQLRLLANNGYTLLATSPSITLT